MSVDLRGLETCVTQQFLDYPEIRPSIEQMGGKGVTQGCLLYTSDAADE